MKTLKGFKVWGVACAALTASVAYAGLLDATVLLNKATDNRTLTVRYEGAKAALAELRINGRSASTRSLDEAKATGELNFTLDTAVMEGGKNEVEVILYDLDGKVVGSQTATVTIDRTAKGPVYLNSPAPGATVSRTVQIDLGFKQQLTNIYASFYIDDQMKLFRNFPPYSYLWDTEQYENGWHEVQVWVVDERNNTFKTEKVRVYVDNVSGRTNRASGHGGGGPTPNTPDLGTGKPSDIRSTAGGDAKASDPANTTVKPNDASAKPISTKATDPKPTPAVGTTAPTKGATADDGTATGHQTLRPDAPRPKIIVHGNQVIIPTSDTKPADDPVLEVGPQIMANLPKIDPENRHAGPLMAINYGSRMPANGAFSIYMDGAEVAFDVQPRVMDGIPLTPFRHLLEHVGAKVKWSHALKEVEAEGMGKDIWLKVGDRYARVDDVRIALELAPFIENGRVIVPLSFIVDSLDVKIDYDTATGHVLVSSQTKAKN